ncbi:hypothetical protein J7K25_05865 [bacterium]|nr:hypothetical protein [bacterium]
MTHRERLKTVLQWQIPDRIPISCRLDIWYRAKQVNHDLPPEVADKSLDQLQLDLGMALQARNARVFTTRYRAPVSYKRYREGAKIYEIWETSKGTLRRISQYGLNDERLGLRPHIVEYPIKSPEDYRVYKEIVSHLEYIRDYESYWNCDRTVGDNGIPIVILGPCPAHDLMINWVGYKDVFFHITDKPDIFADAVATGDRAFQRMWDIVADSPCEIVMHGVNFDSPLTPPSIFKQFFLPYLREFNQRMHEAGKWVAFHADGDMSALLELVVKADFDIADCLACAPMTSCPFERIIEAWRGRIIIWGGIPSTLLEPSTDEESFHSHLEKIVKSVAPGYGFIAGLSDQAMPGALYERIVWMCRFFAKHGRCPIMVNTKDKK